MGVAIPVVGDLQQECMRLRQWIGVKEVCGGSFNPEDVSALIFNDLLEMKLYEFVDDVCQGPPRTVTPLYFCCI